MKTKEKRRYIRLRVYHLLKYKKVSQPQDSPFTLTTIIDIGAGGICFISEEYLPVSTLINLRLNFPGISTWVSALAKVVWIRQKKNSRMYRVGAQFIEIEEQMQKLIDEKIKTVYKRIESRGLLFKIFPAPKKK